MIEDGLVAWLRDADPSLRWQVERDLLELPPAVWERTRARVATEGFGAQLLALQDADGQWAGGAFFPSDFDVTGPEAQPGAGQPYTATTWSLCSLREWGVDAAVLGDTAARLAVHSRWEYQHLPYWGGEVDCCINSWTLSNGLWLGADVDAIVDWFLAHQLEDGGWNCEWVNGSVRSSYHSTLNALKGLLDYERVTGDRVRVGAARRRAEGYLLERGLFRRRSTGQAVAPWVHQIAYPFRWRYNVLNAADYFRAAAMHSGGTPDPRLSEAVAYVRSSRQADGRWLQGDRLPGRVWFEVDVPAGKPSKWLTFFALRLLAWWDAHRPEPAAS